MRFHRRDSLLLDQATKAVHNASNAEAAAAVAAATGSQEERVVLGEGKRGVPIVELFAERYGYRRFGKSIEPDSTMNARYYMYFLEL